MQSRTTKAATTDKINPGGVSTFNSGDTELVKEERKTSNFINLFKKGILNNSDGIDENSDSSLNGVQDFAKISILPPYPFRLQPKLKINSPDDKYEKEADHVAEQVMQMPEPMVQLKCAKCGKEEEQIQRKPLTFSISSLQARLPKTTLQRKCSACQAEEEQIIQAKSTGNSQGVASPNFINQLRNTQGRKETMDNNTRAFMEPRFGMDFNKVRIHTDGRAASMNREINAKAFTVGRDIYFNEGTYQPKTQKGKQLLAHELTHTLQQSKNNKSTWRSSFESQFFQKKSSIDSVENEPQNGSPNSLTPSAIMQSLGEGEPMEGGVRSKMKRAFGKDFPSVSVHTDSHAATLSNRLKARAFTVGNHIVFGRGEYRPGTLIGDALIAHELAHVIQQGNAIESQNSNVANTALEQDANRSAFGAVINILGGFKKGFKNFKKKIVPELRSGLQLQRCPAAAGLAFAGAGGGTVVITTGTTITIAGVTLTAAEATLLLASAVVVGYATSQAVDELEKAIAAASAATTVTVATCEALHTAYKEFNCPKCRKTDTPEIRNAKIACLYAVIAGREAYLKAKCDYILPGSILRGSPTAENGHYTQLNQLKKMLLDCSSLPTIPSSSGAGAGGVNWNRKACCFPGNIPVRTPKGLKRIDQINVGDYVLSCSDNIGQVEYQQVEEVQVHHGEFPILQVHVEDEIIEVTKSHFFALSEGIWKRSEMLEKGMNLKSNKHVKNIQKVTHSRDCAESVFNLKVKGHNYFIGTSALLVRDF